MKTFVKCFVVILLLGLIPANAANAVVAANQYSCAPPFMSNTARPNIHFVLDITGSMKSHPYVGQDSTYTTTTGYWGYFKQDKYYSYDPSANKYWQENASCTDTDLIGKSGCVSGKLLNYVTSNKYDIMRKILTGGRVWSSDSTVLEHELGAFPNYALSDITNEATTNCNFDNKMVGKVNISSPDPVVGAAATILSSSSTKKVSVAISGANTTFTVAGGNYTTTGITAGMQIITSGFSNNANNKTWSVVSITSTVITVTSNGAVAESNKGSVTIKSVGSLTGSGCKVLANTLDIPMTVNATAKTFTRTDGGSFVTDGWTAGMQFDSFGFSDSGNNKAWVFSTDSNSGTTSISTTAWTIASVTASVITVSNSTGMVTNATAKNTRLYQNLTAFVRVKSTTPADFTGLIQSIYIAPGDVNNKADIEMSFFDTDNKIDYMGGTTSNVTVKNQPQVNYLNAVNGSASTGSTNTGPALIEAEKFFKQVAVASSTIVPSSGTLLIAPKNGASDPFYEPPTTVAATNTNSSPTPCRKAFIVLVSDGEWNSGTDPVGPVYNMRRKDTTFDVRPDTTDPYLPGKQNVTTYVVYAFGDTAAGRNSLITTAIFGGFDDSIEVNNLPYPFTSAPVASPYTSTSVALKTFKNPTGYASSSAVAGTTKLFIADDKPTFPIDECNPAGTNTWDSRCAEWDKSKTGLPYNYFEATDGEKLAASLDSAIKDIFAKVASGTAASILSNSEGSGASLLQAVYYPSKVFKGNGATLSWIGEMQNLWYFVDPFIANSSIREDTDGDNVLDLKKDKVVKFYFKDNETRVNLFNDTNGDGTGDTASTVGVDTEDVKSIWRAGKLLQKRDADSRTIHTSLDGLTLETYADTQGGFSSKTTRATNLQPYLQVADLAEAQKVISYVRGTDQTGYRARMAAAEGETAKEWKLGDIISSTPRLQASGRLNNYNLPPATGYNDSSYAQFAATDNYKNRGMVYVGANDGMLHAFKLGKLTVSGLSITGDVKATLTGTNLGEEQWAYVPKNALPYLKYLADPLPLHQFIVDGAIVLADVSTGCSSSDYSQCAKDQSSWRSVLVGSMGLAGASRDSSTTCTEGINGTCVKTPLAGVGFSSYFALDITNQYYTSSGLLAEQPKLKWEFSHPEMGYASSGAAIVHINAKTSINGQAVADTTKNGKWFAVFASGPTGPIDSINHQFRGKSDQNLKIFVVDLGANTLVKDSTYWVLDTGIKRAFGGSMIPAAIDTDRWDSGSQGFYQHDALYLGYSKANIADTAAITTTTEWTDGGVLRILTKEDMNPNNWVVNNPVITGIGPVTAGVAKLQDRNNKKLWLFFGTGRSFYSTDDLSGQRYLFGVQDSCYNSTTNKLDPACTTAPVVMSNLKSQNTIGTLSSTDKGWYISLAPSDSTFGAERVLTDPVAQSNGTVCYTTFMPTSDICKFGGNSYMWCVKYNTGGCVCPSGLNGKALIQVSTGSFEEIDLSKAFHYPSCSGCPTIPGDTTGGGTTTDGVVVPPPTTESGGRKMGSPMAGKPPLDAPPIVSNAALKPVKKILHLQEK